MVKLEKILLIFNTVCILFITGINAYLLYFFIALSNIAKGF